MTWLDGTPMDPAAEAPEPVPAIPGFPFLYDGTAAMIVGPTGRGRSSLVQACAYDAARHGIPAAYLGSEVSRPEFDARAADIAGRRGHRITDELRGDLARARYLDLADTIGRAWQEPEAWAEQAAARYIAVVIDPLSTVASTLGLNFEDNTEFVRFYDRLVQPLLARGVAVLMLDNVGHGEQAQRRAKGASDKANKLDLTFHCAVHARPAGLVIKADKVRSVRAGHRIGDAWLFDRDTMNIARLDAAATDASGPGDYFRPTILMERVSLALEDRPGLTKKQIRQAVKGRNEYVDQALDALIRDGNITVEHIDGSHRHTVVRPYREEAE